MKQPYTITHCECCDAIIDLTSPPSNEQYEKGQIHISDGMMLLPEKAAKQNSHARTISGYYCDFGCLAAVLKAALNR